MKQCKICNCDIPKERIDAFMEIKGIEPDTCVLHSIEEKYIGFLNYEHKTAPTVITVNPGNKESLRRAKRQYFRKR